MDKYIKILIIILVVQCLLYSCFILEQYYLLTAADKYTPLAYWWYEKCIKLSWYLPLNVKLSQFKYLMHFLCYSLLWIKCEICKSLRSVLFLHFTEDPNLSGNAVVFIYTFKLDSPTSHTQTDKNPKYLTALFCHLLLRSL